MGATEKMIEKRLQWSRLTNSFEHVYYYGFADLQIAEMAEVVIHADRSACPDALSLIHI